GWGGGALIARQGCLTKLPRVAGRGHRARRRKRLGPAADATRPAIPTPAWFKTPATRVPPEGSCVCARSAMQSIKCLRQRDLRPQFVAQDSTAGVTLFSTMPAPALR